MQGHHGDQSDSDDESEAVESSDEEFPDTQIQFGSKVNQQKVNNAAAVSGVVDKYGLQDFGEDSNDEADREDDTSSLASTERHSQKSAYITAKMRRDMKKGKPPGQPGHENESSPSQQQQQPKAPVKKPQQGQPKKGAAAPPPTAPPTSVRGKKGKAKKIKEKYADQDEEERQLRLELLAVSLLLIDISFSFLSWTFCRGLTALIFS